jgi:putative FmdB family regulatory protein
VPVYVYRVKSGSEGCSNCKESFEVLQSMSDKPLETCPDCGGAVEKIIVGVSIVRQSIMSGKLTDERIRRAGMRKLVKDDDGRYKDVTGGD